MESEKETNPFECIWVCASKNQLAFIHFPWLNTLPMRDSFHFVLISCAVVVVFIFRNWNIMFARSNIESGPNVRTHITHTMHLIQFIRFSSFDCSYLFTISLTLSLKLSDWAIFSLRFISFSKFRFHQTIALNQCKHGKCVNKFLNTNKQPSAKKIHGAIKITHKQSKKY